jgi:hypothetical protein
MDRADAATAPAQDPESLRWIANALEQVQRMRIQTGERLRACLDGRSGIPVGGAGLSAGDRLERIRRGEETGPSPFLGETYRRYWEEEVRLGEALRLEVAAHPAWPWLEGVQGIGPLLAGKLLARLDVRRAATPSSFWAYCGLATVPGVEYACAECGYTTSMPARFRVSGAHERLGSGRPCGGSLRAVGTPDQGVRAAQPKPARGEVAAYDRQAKKVCYLIGSSFLRAGGPYEAHYRRERAKLDGTRPGWREGRKHLAALRKVEKLFLSHLWLVWRQALELPCTKPYPQARLDCESWVDPWSMTRTRRAGEPASGAPRRLAAAG